MFLQNKFYLLENINEMVISAWNNNIPKLIKLEF